MSSEKGYIMQLQPFSVNDGDGIRTTIFMAGCSLRCQWCANPEGFRQKELIGWYWRRCINCGACTRVCPQKIPVNLNEHRSDCIACGRCTEVCPKDARSYMVRYADAQEIIAQVEKHKLFYSYSGGGVTFSGGEATSQPELLDTLTREFYDMGLSLALETCGTFDFEVVRPSLERMDLIFMDLKHMDPVLHKRFTGQSNERILENMKALKALSAQLVIRIPVIKGANGDEENIRNSARFVHDNLPDAKMELLPYHRFGLMKYEALGLDGDHPEFERPGEEEMARLKEIVREEGVCLEDYR